MIKKPKTQKDKYEDESTLPNSFVGSITENRGNSRVIMDLSRPYYTDDNESTVSIPVVYGEN
jgi:hypothetical protein